MKNYIIPPWCKMPKGYHEDGMGGCWSISHGFLDEFGEKNCLKCEYHESNSEAGEKKGRDGK